MKINIVVDLEDLYPEEEGGNLGEQVQGELVYAVKNEVLKVFKDKGMDLVTKEVNEQFDENFNKEIRNIVLNLFEYKALKNGRTWKQFITEKLENTNYFSEDRDFTTMINNFVKPSVEQVQNEIRQKSEAISKELKNRYDLSFASQLVMKLAENGLLKDGVENLLLDSEK